MANCTCGCTTSWSKPEQTELRNTFVFQYDRLGRAAPHPKHHSVSADCPSLGTHFGIERTLSRRWRRRGYSAGASQTLQTLTFGNSYTNVAVRLGERAREIFFTCTPLHTILTSAPHYSLFPLPDLSTSVSCSTPTRFNSTATPTSLGSEPSRASIC